MTFESQKYFHFFEQSVTGSVRSHNEDYILNDNTLNGYVFVLCDGMGGHKAGAVASKTGAESIIEFFNKVFYSNPYEALGLALIYANQFIYNLSQEADEYKGMGTTAVIVLIRNNEVYYAHVGDSRLYLWHEKKLYQLTKDHSLVQNLVDKLIITKNEAENHPRKNVILRALGSQSTIEPEVCETPFLPANNNILLICSDGLNSMLSDKEIQHIFLTNKRLNDTGKKLVQAANQKGGHDNISIQLIEFKNLGAQKTNFYLQNEEETFKDTFSSKRFWILPIVFIVLTAIVLITMFLNKNKHDEKNQVEKSDSAVLIENNPIYKDSLNITSNEIVIEYVCEVDMELDDILQQFHINLPMFLKFNIGFKHTRLNAGQKINIPVLAIHELAKGQTIEYISTLYSVPSEIIVDANNLKNKDLDSFTVIYIPFP